MALSDVLFKTRSIGHSKEIEINRYEETQSLRDLAPHFKFLLNDIVAVLDGKSLYQGIIVAASVTPSPEIATSEKGGIRWKYRVKFMRGSAECFADYEESEILTIKKQSHAAPLCD